MGKGLLLVSGGVVIALIGVCWGLDARGMTSKFYNATIQSWRRIPFMQGWIERTPYQTFRLQTLIPWTAFGLLMIVLGLHLIATAG
jgi:hypothetical protein